VAVKAIHALETAHQQRAEIDIKNIESSLQIYYTRKGSYPDARSGLRALVDGQILPAIPKDPWGREYLYRLDGNQPRIMSLGRDGTPGGEGFDADISNQPDN
jgi:general secretion pathway protein G